METADVRSAHSSLLTPMFCAHSSKWHSEQIFENLEVVNKYYSNSTNSASPEKYTLISFDLEVCVEKLRKTF